MPLRTLLSLILCNVIWSAHPLMGKYLLLGFSPEQSAWLRYLSALISYTLAVAVLKFSPVSRKMFRGEPFMRPKNSSEAILLLALGFSAFCFSPLLQMTGLASSRATDNSLITAMEPLFTVFIAWLMLHERPSRMHIISFAVALVGFALLTGLGSSPLGLAFDSHLLGNVLLLLSLVGEAMYSSLAQSSSWPILHRRCSARRSPWESSF